MYVTFKKCLPTKAPKDAPLQPPALIHLVMEHVWCCDEVNLDDVFPMTSSKRKLRRLSGKYNKQVEKQESYLRLQFDSVRRSTSLLAEFVSCVPGGILSNPTIRAAQAVNTVKPETLTQLLREVLAEESDIRLCILGHLVVLILIVYWKSGESLWEVCETFAKSLKWGIRLKPSPKFLQVLATNPLDYLEQRHIGCVGAACFLPTSGFWHSTRISQLIAAPPVPPMLHSVIDYVVEHRAVENIFRECGSTSGVKRLVDEFRIFEQVDFDSVRGVTVHEVCSMLKRYLAQFTRPGWDPLLPTWLLHSASDASEAETHLMRLDDHRKYVLGHLLRMMRLVTDCDPAEANKLAWLVGPSFFCQATKWWEVEAGNNLLKAMVTSRSVFESFQFCDACRPQQQPQHGG